MKYEAGFKKVVRVVSVSMVLVLVFGMKTEDSLAVPPVAPYLPSFSVSQEPKVGQPFDLIIRIVSDHNRPSTKIHLKSLRTLSLYDLRILEGSMRWTVDLKAGERIEHRIKMVVTDVSFNSFNLYLDKYRLDSFTIYTTKDKGLLWWGASLPNDPQVIAAAVERKNSLEKEIFDYWNAEDWLGGCRYYYAPSGSGEFKESSDDPYFVYLSPTASKVQNYISKSDFEDVTILKELKKDLTEREKELGPFYLSILHNNIGIAFIANGEWSEGSAEIKKAVQIFESNKELIARENERKFERSCERDKEGNFMSYYRQYSVNGKLYNPWDIKLFPYERVHQFLHQNLTVVYALEGQHIAAEREFEASTIKRKLIEKTAKRILETEEDFAKRLERTKRIRYQIRGKER